MINSGQNVGTAEKKARMNRGNHEGVQVQQAVAPPRLLNLVGAATYLAVSPWTIRELESAGILPRVRVPLPNNGELRKLLFDRRDLDKAIEAWKERSHYV